MADDGAAGARRHLFIAGTGRAGTSFLVRFLAALGLETHLATHAQEEWSEAANAGLEDTPIGTLPTPLPYVVKTPWLCEFADEVLADPRIVVDAVVIPVRDLADAAASRVIEEVRASHQSAPWLAESGHSSETWGVSPGGVVFSLNPVDQGRLLAVWFYQLAQRLVRADVPVIFVDFPRLAEDAEYLFGKLRPVLPPDATMAQARAAHARLADPAKIRVGGERDMARAPRPGAVYDTAAALDRIALGRELVRLRGALAASTQAHDALLRETAALHARLAEQAADIVGLEGRFAASQAGEAAARAALDGVRASRSWRMTAPVRAVGGAVRTVVSR